MCVIEPSPGTSLEVTRRQTTLSEYVCVCVCVRLRTESSPGIGHQGTDYTKTDYTDLEQYVCVHMCAVCSACMYD